MLARDGNLFVFRVHQLQGNGLNNVAAAGIWMLMFGEWSHLYVDSFHLVLRCEVGGPVVAQVAQCHQTVYSPD